MWNVTNVRRELPKIMYKFVEQNRNKHLYSAESSDMNTSNAANDPVFCKLRWK